MNRSRSALDARDEHTNWRNIIGRKAVAWTSLWITLLFPALLPPPTAFTSAGAPPLADVRAEADRGGYRLIDLEELRGRLEREPGRILLVDTRQDWEYRTGHIPDSINFSFEPTWWSRLKNRWALRVALGAETTRPLVFY